MGKIQKIGKRYGKLTVLAVDEKKTAEKKALYYLCKCDCGNIISLHNTSLRDIGGTQSCGCARIGVHRIDITGKKFGELTAIECIGTIGEGRKTATVWKCLCSCGNFTNVPYGSLITGHTTSCGCKLAAALADPTAKVEGIKKSEKVGRFETNIFAKRWTLISPQGQIYHIKNLALFIREHTEFFGIQNIDIETQRQAKRMRKAYYRGTKCDGWTIKCDE